MDGVNAPAVCSLVQHFAGPLASGRWMGVQNAVSNVAGMVAPVVTGYLVEATGHYSAALWLAGVVALVGLVGWLVIVPPVRPVDWGSDCGARAAGDARGALVRETSRPLLVLGMSRAARNRCAVAHRPVGTRHSIASLSESAFDM